MPELLIEIQAQKKFLPDSSGSNVHAPDTTLKSGPNKVVALDLTLKAFAWSLIDT
jgi:hypothetical protein